MTITDYHAHVYFDAASVEQATALCQQTSARFNIPMGHVHRRPVGPHPSWSCQITVPANLFSQVIPWLMVNRRGLTVFAHANTGDDYRDHTDHVLWLGPSQTLDLSIFRANAS